MYSWQSAAAGPLREEMAASQPVQRRLVDEGLRYGITVELVDKFKYLGEMGRDCKEKALVVTRRDAAKLIDLPLVGAQAECGKVISRGVQ